MEKILIVDGSNLLFQMFYGFPSKIYNKSGETIHATIGFVSALLKVIKEYDIGHAVVVFDTEGELSRTKIDESYKANRDVDYDSLPSDEVPFNEEDKIFRALKKMEVNYILAKDMEADDLISLITHKLSKDNEIIIMSHDSDFFQLISDKVSVLRYRGKSSVHYTKEYFSLKFGFDSSKYLFYKALRGDSADNICGLKGIGDKRAACLVNSFNDYDGILSNILCVKPQCIRDTLANGREQFEKNLSLINLTKTEDCIYDISDFSFSKELKQKTNTQILNEAKIFE